MGAPSFTDDTFSKKFSKIIYKINCRRLLKKYKYKVQIIKLGKYQYIQIYTIEQHVWVMYQNTYYV